jgi:chromosome segregation ATPase
MRLRLIKEKHEERLEALTAKIRVIYESIRKDEIIISMRNDPASGAFASQRMKEICHDQMALEREETIERLTDEVAFSQSQLKKLELEVKELRHNLELTQEGFHSERQKFQSLESENKALRSRLASFTKDVEASFKKKTQEFFENRKKTDSEGLERELWQKSSEVDYLAKENQDFKEKLESLKDELGKLILELKEKDLIIAETREKLIRTQQDQANLLKDKNLLKEKQVDYGQQFKNIMDFEEKSHKDSIDELNATFKEKTSRFKRKILEQKKVIQFLEGEVSNAREIANNSKQGLEKSLLMAQEDLKRVKDQWEKRCREIEKDNSLLLSEVQIKHQSQISELQRHYQDLLEAKIKEFQSEHTSHFSKQRALDYELKKIMDEKIAQVEKDYILISKHEAILNEETSKLRIKHLQEIREIEENWNKDLLSKMRELKDNNSTECEKMMQKILIFEQEKNELLQINRSLEGDLQFGRDKIENLTVKVQELKKELNSSEVAKQELYKEIEDSQIQVTRLQAQVEDQVFKRNQVELEIEKEREKISEMQNSLKRSENDLNFKHKNESSAFQEQISVYEDNLAKEQQRAKRLLNEVDHYQRLCAQLEKEIEEVKDLHSRETQEFFTSSQRFKQDEQLKYEKEVENHLETRRLLIQAEHKAKILESDLEASEKMGNELRLLTSKYEKEISDLRRSVSHLESSLASCEKVTSRLRKELESSKEDENSVRIINKKALKDNLERFREEGVN